MSNLTLDGSTSFIGTEFIKLLATGSSNLATVEYVDDAIEQNGGGGNVDLSNYYTQTEVDNLLNAKLNVNNPQDITGILRIDSTNGNGKLIVNAVGAPNDEDFYVNGLSNLGGTLKCQLLQASSNIETSQQIQSDTYNTNTNSNMVIQRNSIDYIVLESDKVNFKKDIYLNDVLFTGSGNPFDENVVINNPYELQCNNFNNSVLNQDMVFNINGGEWFRLQFSDNTVRVPNTKSFLSQNIFTDIIKPLAFTNDVVFNGGNSTNDAYEEYMRLDASTEKVSVSKNIDTSENIYMNLNKRLYLNDTVGSERYIGSTFRSGTPSFNQLDIVNENSSNGRIRLMINTEENVIVENSQLYSRRVITANAGVNSNTYNSNGDNIVNLQQNGNTFISLSGNNNRVNVNRLLRVVDSGNSTQCQFIQSSNGNYMSFTLGNHISAYSSGGANGNTLHLNYYSHANVFLGTNQDTTPDPKPTITINKFSSDTGNAFEVAGDSQFSGDIVIDTGKSVKTNTINSNGDNDVVFQRDDVEFFKLDKFTEDTVEKEAIICSKQLRANGNILVDKLQINQFPVGIEYADFRLEDADSIMRFYAGNSTSVNLQITNTELTLGRLAICNSGIKTNVIDTTIDTDLIFRRNGVEYFRLDDLAGTDILNVANDKGVSASYVFGNRFWNRSFSSDTTFFGSNVAGDDRVEYMKWNYLSQSVDYNAPIDNTGLAITGNIIDTTVSDERLKTNIEDVDTDFTSCIKNVKVKTFKYKDDKYKTNDNYGFIAQELKEHLPKECKNIVKENKVKNEDDTFLSINYMKLSVVLWKCCQEQQSKIEHLEASMYEMMEDIKELKGKKTTKPKAKAKSKEKSEK